LGFTLHDSAQPTLEEFAAYHLRDVIFNLDMLTIARTTKLMPETEKLKAEDEGASDERLRDNRAQMETEFHGGANADDLEPESESYGERTEPVHTFDVKELSSMLTRQSEVAAGKKKGRKKHTDVQMKVFDDRFHDALNTPVRQSPVKLYEVQLAYTNAQAQAAALKTQDAILQQLRAEQPDIDAAGADPKDFVEAAVLHNLRKQNATRQWIDLDDALRGPAHVAKTLIRRCQEKRSEPNKPYRLNAEQLACVALYVAKLEHGFAKRPDPSQP